MLKFERSIPLMQYMSKRDAVNSGMLDKSYLPTEDMDHEEEQKLENQVAFFYPEIKCHMVVDNSLYEDKRAVPALVKPLFVTWEPMEKRIGMYDPIIDMSGFWLTNEDLILLNRDTIARMK